MKKRMLNFGVIVLISIFLECVWFNFEYVKAKLDTSQEYNIEYTQENMIKINWTEKDGNWITQADPELIIEDVNTYVASISVQYSTDDEIDNILIFYTNKEVQEINGDLLIVNSEVGLSETSIEVNDYVGILRIDLGEAEGVAFQKIKVIINPLSFHFSLSRVFAMVLIYLISKGLFALQNPPNYGLDEEN